MSKIVLPYTVNWGEGTYPVSGDLWSGQPVRQAPAVRYFTPNERAATPLINYALWESQEAARRISDALVVADLEGGNMFSSSAYFYNTTASGYDEQYGAMISSFTSATEHGFLEVRQAARGNVAGTPVWPLATVGPCVALGFGYAGSLSPGDWRRWMFRSGGSSGDALVWTVGVGLTAIGAGGATHTIPANSNGAWIRDGVTMWLAATVPASNFIRFFRYNPATGNWHSSQELALPASHAGCLLEASIGTPRTIVTTALGNTNVMRVFRLSGPLGTWSEGTPVTASTAGMEWIGCQWDPFRERYVAVAVLRSTPFTYDVWESLDGLAWTKATDNGGDFNFDGLTPIGGALKGECFRVYGSAWLLLASSGTTARIWYTFDRGMSWHAARTYVDMEAATPANWAVGAFRAPKIVASPMGLAVWGYRSTSGGAGTTNFLWLGPVGGRRGPLFF